MQLNLGATDPDFETHGLGFSFIFDFRMHKRIIVSCPDENVHRSPTSGNNWIKTYYIYLSSLNIINKYYIAANKSTDQHEVTFAGGF